MADCPHCRAHLETHDLFCPHCGQTIEPADDPRESQIRKYASDCRKQGILDARIREQLLHAGWKATQVEGVMGSSDPERPTLVVNVQNTASASVGRAPPQSQVAKVTIGTLLSWILGLAFLLVGISSTLDSEFAFGLISAALGVLLIPPLGDRLFKGLGFQLSGGIKIILVIGGIFIMGSSLSHNNVTPEVPLATSASGDSAPQNQPAEAAPTEEPACNVSCGYTEARCKGTAIVVCTDTNGDGCKEESTAKICPSSCIEGRCLYREGETIRKGELDVAVLFAKPVMLIESMGFGSSAKPAFKVRFAITNNGETEESFTSPEYLTVLLDDLGNQYEPTTFLFAEDREGREDFGDGSVFPGATKKADVYFDPLSKNTSSSRVILKTSFFSSY